MNYGKLEGTNVVFFKDDIVGNKTPLFCKKRRETCGCRNFICDAKDGFSKCPFGMTVAKTGVSFVCGFGCDFGYYSDNQVIKRRNDVNVSDSKIPILKKCDGELFLSILDGEIYREISSEAAHEITHFVGDLKTLIEFYNAHDVHLFDEVDEIVLGYQKYIDASNTFQETKGERIDEDWFEHPNKYKEYLSIIKRQRERYETFLGAIAENAKNLKNKVDNFYERHYESFKNNKREKIISLLAIQSLFSCRIEYYEQQINSALKGEIKEDKKPKFMNLHKILKKLVCILQQKAQRKRLRFVFDGQTKSTVKVYEDMYLAFYILLENAIKFSLYGSEIIIHLKDKGHHGGEVSITNPSGYISPESLSRIADLGFSGENAEGKGSHGIGLFVVNRICDHNQCQYSYNYDDETKLYRYSMCFTL